MAKIDIINFQNAVVGTYQIPTSFIVDKKQSKQPLFDQVLAFTSGNRQGTHSTLTKAEVRGGGKKPRPQKHSGNARQGSIRNPHFVGGGVAFGPKPNRNYKLSFNKKIAKLAIKLAINQKIENNEILILEIKNIPNKTNSIIKFVKLLKIDNLSILFVLNDKNFKMNKSIRNIKNAIVKKDNQVSTYDILKAKKVIFDSSTLTTFFGGTK